MAISAQIINGKVVSGFTAGTNLTEETKGNDSLDKDAFLKILVAEMQYQDPLEPSSNTEWVNQMASFSQIEELQNVSDTISDQKAENLVGKRVIIAAAEETTGETKYVTGIVQCTEKKDGEMYISVNDYLYSIDQLYSVVDEEYYKDLISKGEEGTSGDDTE